ncbi:MAG: hypothetical protein KKF48_04325 [Nanoarchaeota archaeon]|nr:hypothetical protein [Nanoarchaeota archaeon]MBU1028244.1 hypothetical protein [Nanoarchaeota archaeon]
MKNKFGQATVFIIIAVLIVGIIAIYYTTKNGVSVTGVPANIEPIYSSFLSCLENEVGVGISILESQGGYIELPDFEPGSTYMPFSSQLDFLGNPIPYWYYVSANNIQKEQVPTLQEMQFQLGNFLEDRARNCRFEEYYNAGFEITQGEAKAIVSIKNNEVDVSFNMEFNVVKGEDTAVFRDHKIVVASRLGKLYDSAIEVYNKEQEELFLEGYGVDILRSYAPVDGVELTCSPMVWNADEVFDELENAIETNTLALKTGKNNDYFAVDLNIESGVDVRFLNFKQWPHGFEVAPSEGPVLISNPIGNQPGIGILGFCYVPYHFVYNVRYPVLIQVSEADEVFQFPVAIVLQGNVPRQALDVSSIELGIPDFCKNKNTLIEVGVYDTNLRPVDADISYECLGTRCNIGKTSSGYLETNFPQCANGVVTAKAQGFKDAKQIFSTIQEGGVDIILDKIYGLEIDLKLDGKSYDKEAIISFISDDNSKTIVYPDTKIVELSEGQYEVSVYVYKTSSLKIPSTTQEQCVEVPRSGLGGLFGLTQQNCFDIEIPSQDVSNALAGGGKQNYYLLESELRNSNIVEINADSLTTPKTLEELQNNYFLFDGKGLDIVFK